MKFYVAYVAALDTVLEQGGKQEIIEKAVSEINNPTDDGLQAWLIANPSQPCSRCGANYHPTDATLSQEMLCTTCRKTPN